MRKYLSDKRENVSIQYIWQCFNDAGQALILYEDILSEPRIHTDFTDLLQF